MKTSIKAFMLAIVVMGIIRFALTMAGVDNGIVKYFSMTVIIMAGTIYFAFASASHKERLKDAYLLLIPYMIIEVAALGYSWASGHETIFHAKEYSFGVNIRLHTIGHFVGGLTWEPLGVFVLMEIVWGIGMIGRRLTGAPRSAGL